jgi:hypothetical protein
MIFLKTDPMTQVLVDALEAVHTVKSALQGNALAGLKKQEAQQLRSLCYDIGTTVQWVAAELKTEGEQNE